MCGVWTSLSEIKVMCVLWFLSCQRLECDQC